MGSTCKAPNITLAIDIFDVTGLASYITNTEHNPQMNSEHQRRHFFKNIDKDLVCRLFKFEEVKNCEWTSTLAQTHTNGVWETYYKYIYILNTIES